MGEPFRGTGRFAVRRQLGAGSYGAVYEAYDRTRETTVALKVLTELEPGSLYDFKKEFRRLCGLAHPNLVTLHELFQEGGHWFFTMELVRGEDLLSFVRPGGVWDEARCLAAFRQLAEGVHALHLGGRLHRDLKPKNVMVAADGRVVLLDFGFVAQLGRRWDRSIEAGVAGTAAYMAPELVRQLPSSPGSDWYAVGVMLYQALAGRLPFDGGPLEVLRAKLTRAAPPLTEDGATHPPALAALCMALLDRRPQARPAPEEILRLFGGAQDAPSGPDDAVAVAGAGVGGRLVGRDSELETLRRALERSREDGPVTVQIRGLAGIGKTALAEGFLDRLGAAEMAVCLRVRGSTRETVPAQVLDALVDALGRHLLRLGEGAAAVLPADVGALVARFPALARVPAVAAAAARGGESTVPAGDLPTRALAALKACLRAVASCAPLVVCVDDDQGADAESRAALEALLAAPDPPGLLLVTCARIEPRGDADPGGGVVPLALNPSAADSRAGSGLNLGPLSSDAIAALVRRIGGVAADGEDAVDGGDARLDALVREAAGSPFLAIELAQAAGRAPGLAEGSLTLGAVVRQQLSTLSDGARRLVEVLAIAKAPVARPALIGAAGLGPHEALDALETLHAERLIRTTARAAGGALIAYHDRVRACIAEALSPGRRADRHRRLAEALEAAGAPPATLAYHYREAGDLEGAAALAAEGATASATASAPPPPPPPDGPASPAFAPEAPGSGGEAVVSDGLVSRRDVLAGRRLGPCELRERIGSGGMGVVYRGWHLSLRRDVAVKVLPELYVAEPTRLARFEREARAAAGLDHPGIVRIYDLGQADGYAYIVQELVEGEPLDRRLAESGRLGVRRALEIARGVADALGCAHDAGVVHRDIKPGNILLTPDGRVKVVDFGLAKPSGDDGEAALSVVGQVLGSPGYMSPEQCRGEGDVDGRADLYGLGAVLFHLLAGRPPFQAQSLSGFLFHHAYTEPPRLVELVDGVPAPVSALVDRLLAKDPAARFQSADELVAALDALLESGFTEPSSVASPPPGEPEKKPAPQPPGKPPTQPPKKWRRVGLGAAVGLVVVLGSGVVWRAVRRSRPVGPPRVAAPRDVDPPSFTLEPVASKVDAPTVWIRGTVGESGCRVRVGGLEAEVDGARFQIRIPLQAGAGEVRVEAIDAAGNAAQKTVAIACSAPAGWAGQALPAGIRRASQSGVYLWDSGHGLAIEMVYVPPGAFPMGNDDLSGARPAHRHAIRAPYYIGRFETTWAQYRIFCRQAGHVVPAAPRWGVEAEHPVVNVSWDDADAFCRWAGLQLPTEAQWERAARGTDGRRYPWGADPPDPRHPDRCVFRLFPRFGGRTTAPVGSAPTDTSPVGALDMAGNVWEWCAEAFDSARYQRCVEGEVEAPQSGANRVLRGGGWGSGAPFVRVDRRLSRRHNERRTHIGFRPVKVVD